MTTSTLRRFGAPLAIASVVLALVLGVVWIVDPTGTGSGGSVIGSPGSDGSSGGSDPVSPSSGPAGPSSGDPVAPAPDPDAPMTRFTAVTAGADARSLHLQFWGGVDDCYSYTVRTQETPERVTLMLVEKNTSDGRPCIDLAQEYNRTVSLDGALGARHVVDAMTDEVLLAPSP